MNVNLTHFDHDARLSDWSRARDVISGKDAGDKYLPRLDAEADDTSANRMRASFYRAATSTDVGFVAMTIRHAAFQRPSKQKMRRLTAEARQLRQTGENSILANIAPSVRGSLTQKLPWGYRWISSEVTPGHVPVQQVRFELSTDSNTKGREAQELRVVVYSWRAGSITQDNMLELLRIGEILLEGRSNEENESCTCRPHAPCL